MDRRCMLCCCAGSGACCVDVPYNATHSGLKQLPSDPRRVWPLPCAGFRPNDRRSDNSSDRCAGAVGKCDLGNISNMNTAQILQITPPGSLRLTTS